MMDAINAPIEIDTNVDIKIQRSNQIQEKKFKCTCCGASWDAQKNHFSKSASPLYQSNDGYINICNDCRDKYYYRLIDFYSGNEAHAIKHMCQQFDIIFHDDALSASKQISADRSRFSHYLAKKNLGQTARIGSTYLEGLKWDYLHKQEDIIESREQAKEDEKSVTIAAIDRWGVGFTESDYKLLDEHYKMLKKNNPNCDNNQEIFVRDLCYTKLLQMKAMRGEGKSDDFDKYTRLYRDTFKQAGLKTIQETDASADETFGVTLATIAQYTPEEYYKDKRLYKDFDGLGDYITRFITRPLKNLQHGTTDRDKEYSVKDGDEDE